MTRPIRSHRGVWVSRQNMRLFLQLAERRFAHIRGEKFFSKSFPWSILYFRVYIAWYKHERGWENSRQLCKPETKSRVCITVENSLNASSVYIRLCKHRKNVFYGFYKINFPRKNAKLFVWHWLKEKFLPVAKSCPRSLARVISSCFAKRCFPKYGLF